MYRRSKIFYFFRIKCAIFNEIFFKGFVVHNLTARSSLWKFTAEVSTDLKRVSFANLFFENYLSDFNGFFPRLGGSRRARKILQRRKHRGPDDEICGNEVRFEICLFLEKKNWIRIEFF